MKWNLRDTGLSDSKVYGTHIAVAVAENVKSKDSSQQASGGEHKNWLSGSGSLGMTGAKDSTARMKTIAAQVVDHSPRPPVL